MGYESPRRANGEGFGVLHRGERTKPNPNRQPAQADHRTALLIARDHGQELMSSAFSRDAVALGWWLHREADIALTTPGLSPELVERAVRCCRHLALAAMEIERLEAGR